MIHIQLACITVLCVLFPRYAAQTQPEVTTPLGPVIGLHKKSYYGRTFSAFEGIPYAKSPVGPLRFSAPEPAEPWTDTLNATKTYMCIQLDPINAGQTYGQEDCLYLNVYVPREHPNNTEKLDVLVNIHGGGFYMGSGSSFNFPDYLMDREVVWVTMNYRLGILGFLSTGDDVIPGNFGLKDQNLALKWVQQNIASFGGNPDSVTLTGQSAGAASVHLHYFSPMSKGLFHRGISHSSSALDTFSVLREPLLRAKRLAVLTNCSVENTAKFLDCLRGKSAEELTLKFLDFMGFYNWMVLAFMPVIENSSNGFLTESPFELVKQKKVLDIPWVSTLTQNEGLYFTLTITPNLDELNDKWEKLAQIILNYNYTLPEQDWPSVASQIKEFYFKDANISLDTQEMLSKMVSDRYFLTGGDSSARYHAAAVSSPVYHYNFNYRGTYSGTQALTQDNTVLGTTHCDDMLYIYTPNMLNSSLDPSEEDKKITKLLLDFVTYYAQTGIAKFGDVNWEPIKGDTLSYINITSSTDVKVETVNELCNKEIWQTVGLLDTYN